MCYVQSLACLEKKLFAGNLARFVEGMINSSTGIQKDLIEAARASCVLFVHENVETLWVRRAFWHGEKKYSICMRWALSHQRFCVRLRVLVVVKNTSRLDFFVRGDD